MKAPVRPPAEQDLLPDSATPFERALSLGDAVTHTARVYDPDLVRRVKDPARCPLHLLPYLAWERSVHEWDPDWPEWRKRNAVADSLDLHRRYGTRWGIERALNELGLGAEVDEWFEYNGRPYCFRVRIPVPDGWTTRLTRTVYRVAIGSKNARSYLDGLVLEAPEARAPVAVGAVASQRRRISATTGAVSGYPLPPMPVLVGAAALRRSRIYAVISEVRTAIAFPAAEDRIGAVALQRRLLQASTGSVSGYPLPPAPAPVGAAALMRHLLYART